MKKEFNLSEKIWRCEDGYHPSENVLLVGDIKEFIKRDEILINMWVAGEISEDDFWERRIKLAGEDLI